MTYPGGKGTSFQKIINQIPPHRVYIEPFLGHGAVMREKRPALLNIGIDKNYDSVHMARSLIVNRGDESDGALPGLIVNRGDDGRNRQSWRCAPDLIASDGDGRGYRHSRRYGRIAESGDASVKYLFICGDALNFISSYPCDGNEFVYCDPPYMFEVRNRAYYDCEFGEVGEHEKLLSTIKELPCKVAISGYMSELYMDELSGWRLIEWESMTRGGKLASECLWMNYQSPKRLHEYTFLGGDFRERERIRRKAARWVARFQALPNLERLAIIDKLNDEGVL